MGGINGEGGGVSAGLRNGFGEHGVSGRGAVAERKWGRSGAHG